jgi:hypothetical protein
MCETSKLVLKGNEAPRGTLKSRKRADRNFVVRQNVHERDGENVPSKTPG